MRSPETVVESSCAPALLLSTDPKGVGGCSPAAAAPAPRPKLAEVLLTEKAKIYAKRPDLRRAELRRMIRDRGWTEEIEYIGARMVYAATMIEQSAQRQNTFLAQIREEIKSPWQESKPRPVGLHGLTTSLA